MIAARIVLCLIMIAGLIIAAAGLMTAADDPTDFIAGMGISGAGLIGYWALGLVVRR